MTASDLAGHTPTRKETREERQEHYRIADIECQRVWNARLLAITEGCRDDMHEPDEQDLVARVVGNRLDNACGEFIGVDAIVQGWQEIVVCFERMKDGELMRESFNFASLVALARKGASAPQLLADRNALQVENANLHTELESLQVELTAVEAERDGLRAALRGVLSFIQDAVSLDVLNAQEVAESCDITAARTLLAAQPEVVK